MDGGPPGKALFTVSGVEAGKPPSREEAARQLGVSPEAIDASFGVVLVDPVANLYGVQVDPSQVPAEIAGGEADFRGPFSDPRIEPMGPPTGPDEPKRDGDDRD
jgi:hypothetical protein